MADEGVHEIQLNGKQLVFMFMAVTVVAVVIFLCGVMVGRGVRAPRAAEQADATLESTIDPTASVSAPPAPSTPTDPSSSATAPGQEKPTVSSLLTAETPPPETLKEPIAPASAVKPAVGEKTAVTPAVRTSKPVPSQPAGNGYVVQVAAVKERREAETIANRLSSKGFPSFVTAPSAGAPNVYRVRVGKYNDRREAESVARRLEKEEQFKPWITR